MHQNECLGMCLCVSLLLFVYLSLYLCLSLSRSLCLPLSLSQWLSVCRCVSLPVPVFAVPVPVAVSLSLSAHVRSSLDGETHTDTCQICYVAHSIYTAKASSRDFRRPVQSNRVLRSTGGLGAIQIALKGATSASLERATKYGASPVRILGSAAVGSLLC